MCLVTRDSFVLARPSFNCCDLFLDEEKQDMLQKLLVSSFLLLPIQLLTLRSLLFSAKTTSISASSWRSFILSVQIKHVFLLSSGSAWMSSFPSSYKHTHSHKHTHTTYIHTHCSVIHLLWLLFILIRKNINHTKKQQWIQMSSWTQIYVFIVNSKVKSDKNINIDTKYFQFFPLLKKL